MAKHSEYFTEKRKEAYKCVVALPHAERVSAVPDTQAAAITLANDQSRKE